MTLYSMHLPGIVPVQFSEADHPFGNVPAFNADPSYMDVSLLDPAITLSSNGPYIAMPTSGRSAHARMAWGMMGYNSIEASGTVTFCYAGLRTTGSTYYEAPIHTFDWNLSTLVDSIISAEDESIWHRAGAGSGNVLGTDDFPFQRVGDSGPLFGSNVVGNSQTQGVALGRDLNWQFPEYTASSSETTANGNVYRVAVTASLYANSSCAYVTDSGVIYCFIFTAQLVFTLLENGGDTGSTVTIDMTFAPAYISDNFEDNPTRGYEDDVAIQSTPVQINAVDQNSDPLVSSTMFSDAEPQLMYIGDGTPEPTEEDPDPEPVPSYAYYSHRVFGTITLSDPVVRTALPDPPA